MHRGGVSTDCSCHCRAGPSTARTSVGVLLRRSGTCTMMMTCTVRVIKHHIILHNIDTIQKIISVISYYQA